jgi:protein ImuB
VNSEPSARPRRYLAVWFPWLPSDRLRRQERRDDTPPEDAPPVVLAEKIKGALRLAAVDPAAARAGLTSGLALADARARTAEQPAHGLLRPGSDRA